MIVIVVSIFNVCQNLGTLSVIYAVDELKNPLPVQQCCLKLIGIALEGEMVFFQISKGFGYRFRIV